MIGNIVEKEKVQKSVSGLYNVIRQVAKKLLPDKLVYEYHYHKAAPKKVRKKLIFEIHIVEHCNLNCKACNNFSCIAKPSFLDIEEFRKDLSRIREIFENRVEQIQLLGGEPLLHPNLEQFCEAAREIFPENTTRIRIVTNGTLLLKQPETLWSVCRNMNIEFNVTRYPIKYDYEKALSFVKNKGIFIEYGQLTDKTMSIFPIDPAGKQDYKKSFAICERANTCISLKHGKLYPCTMIPNVYAFNEEFDEHIPITENDSIDIYSRDINEEKILLRLTKPFPICAYCDPGHIVNGIKWGVTKRDKKEWVL